MVQNARSANRLRTAPPGAAQPPPRASPPFSAGARHRIQTHAPNKPNALAKQKNPACVARQIAPA